MKNKISLMLLTISTLLAPLASRADLIWYEGFNYANGNITNVSNGLWVNFSGSGNHDMFVNSSTLQVATTSAPDGTNRADDDDRLFSVTNNSTYTNHVQLVYASFTIICSNLPNGVGSYFASFYSAKNGYCGRIQAFTNGTTLPNTWRLGLTDAVSSTNKADGGFPVDLALDTPYQVVEELDPINLGAATIWINPTNLNDTGYSYINGGTSLDTRYTASDSIAFQTTNQVTGYAFRQASSFGNGFWVITNLDVTTTFAEAVTNISPTNAVPPTIAYPPIGLTNYVGNPVSLSAVANGQGLAGLSYQWQQNGTNYPNNATANILNIPNASTNDSGSYTLIVTTPYGLSTTSSPVTVFISSAIVPPAFVSQPVSQTVYSGQPVTFSTTVISPDINTVFYQWKSNGVDIAGANASTYTLNKATTNFSGSMYSVGVTNDVTPTGIVSTNAVLTVINPQTVSIHYLRTLVDPLNGYSPTNTTIPYQVTGTVTTFTNLTTGTTSSYYLQDGTGGIDIFITGDSTFRPAQGDVVTFIGVLSGFSTGLELEADVTPSTIYPYTSYTDTGVTNALPAPISIAFNVTNTANLPYVNTNLAGSLVQLTDVHFGTNSGLVLSTTANNTVTVTNSSGQKFNLIFFDLDLDTAGKTLPTNAISVTGALYGINTNFSVAVTRFSDIVTIPPVLIPTNPPAITNFSLAGGNVLIGGTNGQSGGTYYLLTSTNLLTPLSQWTPVATNVVGTTNNFTFIGTNAVIPGDQQQFYRLSSTNN
jgi:hypothetical protein